MIPHISPSAFVVVVCLLFLLFCCLFVCCFVFSSFFRGGGMWALFVCLLFSIVFFFFYVIVLFIVWLVGWLAGCSWDLYLFLFAFLIHLIISCHSHHPRHVSRTFLIIF